MDKIKLLDMLISNHALFERLVSQVSGERMLGPLEGDPRSGKDIVAHVTTWQRRLTDWFKVVARGGIPHSPEPGTTWEDMDRLNEQTVLRDKSRSLEDIMFDFHQSFQAFITLVQSFSEEDLNTQYPFAWGELSAGEESRPLWVSVIAGPGYAHYQDHIFDLLWRVDPARRFTPELETLKSYVGTYARPQREPFIFSVEDGHLLARSWGQTFSCLALDETRFAFQDLGLITFYPALNGTVPTLEWWTWLFNRVEEM